MAFQHTGVCLETIWVERGYHEKPDVLRAELQRRIDEAEANGASQILLAYGLCGGGIAGLRTRVAKLAVPRFDDCVNFMLETGCRTCRGKAKAGVYYLTHGWVHDTSASPSKMRERYIECYGERKAKRLMHAMFKAYKSVTLIDNGCYDLESVQPVARKFAHAIEVDVVDSVPGSNVILEKLLCGPWDDDILVVDPGVAVEQDDFAYPPEPRCE
ncbi:MAG: DUF1638 domain-containing protein [Eggerthellaceae bacterium]|nr:DUF1638 domain-containing protein [Eggerthellaceae bacterium]